MYDLDNYLRDPILRALLILNVSNVIGVGSKVIGLTQIFYSNLYIENILILKSGFWTNRESVRISKNQSKSNGQ